MVSICLYHMGQVETIESHPCFLHLNISHHCLAVSEDFCFYRSSSSLLVELTHRVLIAGREGTFCFIYGIRGPWQGLHNPGLTKSGTKGLAHVPSMFISEIHPS